MTEEMKLKLFEGMLRLEKLSQTPTFDGRDYNEQANGAYGMLQILGINLEYLKWADDKLF